MNKIYKFLKIITMAIFIIGTIESCTKAYTWEDFVDFCTYTKEYNINSTNSRINNKRNVFINRSTELKQQAISLGINPENYNSFLITETAGTSTQTCIAMFNTTQYSIINSTHINFTANVNLDCIFIHEYGNIRKYSTTIKIITDNAIGLIDGNPTGTYGNAILQDKWNYAVIQGNTDSFTNDMAPYGFYIGDVFIGGSQENKEIKLFINDEEQDVEIQTTQSESIGGYTYLTRVFKTNLINGETYNLRIYEENNLIYKSEEFVIAWTGENTTSGDKLPPSGTITNNSGDTTGNIDLTGITQGLENITEAQKETTQAIVSGNQQIISAITDTNIFSGDEPTFEDLPQLEVEDVSEDFFTWLLTNIRDIFTDTSEQTLEIQLYNNTYTIRSDVVKFKLEPLKTFIEAGWYFIIGVPFLKYIRRTIEKIKGGEIPASDEKSDLLGNVL